jgi:hippurate hydrolase
MDIALAEKLTGWRRHLHAHPEISLQERETAAFVSARLTELGVKHETGIGGHGIVATISRGGSNRSVGLRADMDALPITEQTNLPHASRNPNAMHACGHDGHTTSLLGAAALLVADASWAGTVHLVFQPAEEGCGGARAMMADGLFTRFPMDRIFGYHNWPGLDAGTVAVHDGPVMAAAARVIITLDGTAGHAALPHLARDPMLAAGHLLVALQSIVAREVDPMQSAVVSMCMIEGGVAANQIPSKVTLRGTTRSYSRAVRDGIDASIYRISNGIAATFGLTATVEIRHGVSPTINHKAEADLAAAVCAQAGIPVRRDLPPAMTGEDFGWYLEEIPGAFVWIGNGPSDDGRELHHPNYDFNDAILPAASTYLAEVAKRSLQG